MANSKYSAFLCAAENSSITKAADILGYTQSGVSHLVAALEEELGIVLLQRGKSGTTPTKEGEELLPYVQRVLAAERDLEAAAAHMRKLETGRLTIGTFSSVAISCLPSLIRAFKAKHGGIEISVKSGTYADIEQDLATGKVDCGFVTLPTKGEFTSFPIMKDRLMAIVKSTDPIAKLACVAPKHLAKEDFIVPAEGTDYDVGKLFGAAGIKLKTGFVMNDDYAAVAMVGSGLGVTVLPELMAKSIIARGVSAVPIESSERTIGIAVSKNRHISPAVREFIAMAQREMVKYIV